MGRGEGVDYETSGEEICQRRELMMHKVLAEGNIAPWFPCLAIDGEKTREKEEYAHTQVMQRLERIVIVYLAERVPPHDHDTDPEEGS